MPSSNIQNAVGKDQTKTFGQLFEGLKKEEQQYDVLKEKLIDYISTHNEFNVIREEWLKNYLDSLDNISDHWEDINQWIEENSEVFSEFTGTFSDIRDIFQEIVSLTQRSSSVVNERQRIARNVRDLALESENIARREGGLSDRQLTTLTRRVEKAKEQFEYQIKILTGGKTDQEAINKAREREQDLLDSSKSALWRSKVEERRLRDQLSTAAGRERNQILEKIRAEKDYQRELEAENRLHIQALEYLSDYTKQAAESLVDLTSKLKEYYRLEKSDSKNKSSQVSLISRILRKGGMTSAAADLEEDNSEFISKKVVARQERDRAAAKVRVADKALGRSVEEANKVKGINVSREDDLSDSLTNTVDALNTARENLKNVDNLVGKKLKIGVEEARGVKDDLKKQLAEEIARLEREYEVLSRVHKRQQDFGQAKEDQKKTEEETEKILHEEYNLSAVIQKNLEGWLRPLMSASALAGAIFTNFLRINGETAHVKQLVGEWTMGYARANWGQATILETTKLIAELTEKMGANPIAIFTSREMGQISEAKKLMGLTADQAAGLAIQSKLNGVHANEYREALQRGIGAGQILNRTVVSQGVATREALAASDAIKVSMGNNAEQIGRAVVAAKSLGMTLQEVEGISRNLINFESSIQAEMQAQLLTGHRLNLAKARELALNNDLEGVVKEIGRQGITMTQYGRMNYIQQDNLAKALGMSRDQMAKMLVTQSLSEGLTAKQIAQAGLMNEKQIEAISLQENWKTVLGNVAGMLTPILQLLNPIVELVSKLVGFASGVFGYLLEPLDRAATKLSSIIGKWEGWGGIIRKTNSEGVNFIQILGSIITVFGLIAIARRRAFGGILRPVLSITRGILGWIPAIAKAAAAAGAARGPLNTLNQDVHTPGGVPQGPSRMGNLFSKLGRNMDKIALGAVAMGIMSLALIGFAKACQMMQGIGKETFWQTIGGLAGLTLAVISLGLTMNVAGEAIIAGALAMVIVAGSLHILGQALHQFEGLNFKGMFEGFPKAMINLALGSLAAAAAAPALLVGSVALLGASIPLGRAMRNLAAVTGSELKSVAEGIVAIAEAVGELTPKLKDIPADKLLTLGKAFKGLKGSQFFIEQPQVKEPIQVPAENLQEKSGIQKENIEASVQEITVKQAQIQASAQKFTVEQKAADLSRVEGKIDAVVRAIESLNFTFDVQEFGFALKRDVPGINI